MTTMYDAVNVNNIPADATLVAGHHPTFLSAVLL